MRAKSLRNALPVVLTLPCAALVAWLGSEVVSLRSTVEATMAVAANPTAVAMVNVEKVFDRLDESADWQIQIRQLASSVQEEGRARAADVERMRKELEPMAEGPDRQRLLDELALKQLRLEEWGRLKQLEIDRERSLMWQKMYRAVREEAAKVAESEGYQLVLVDDSGIEIRTSREVNAPLEIQAQQQIASLRVLYAASAIDITEKVVVRINNRR
jgi:Skp family chaperone for outer membrane proteins